MEKNPKIEFFFEKATQWQDEYKFLREIPLSCGLMEEVKWGVPCYTYQDTNVVLIHGFKEYCALLFHKGVLLKDPENLLIQQTENVQSARQMRFTNLQQIQELLPHIRAYIYEAIEVERLGLKVEHKKTSEFVVAEEFQARLDVDAELKTAFEALTPGRQRAYLLHFSQPKQAKTREARIDKCREMILIGKGLND